MIATLISISLLLISLSNKYVLTQDFYDRNGQPLSGIPELEEVAYQNIQHTIYLYSTIYMIIKLLVITTVLYTGLNYFDIKARFGKVLRVVAFAEFIFLVPAVVKVWWFYHYVPDASLEQWEDFYFLSAASLNDYIKPVNLYPLQTFNVFEIAYWFLLAAGISHLTKVEFDRALRVVVSSYVPALFLWIVFVVFMTMMYYPQAY